MNMIYSFTCINARSARAIALRRDVGPARAFLGEAEKTPWLCVVLGPASRVKRATAFPYTRHTGREGGLSEPRACLVNSFTAPCLLPLALNYK